MLNMPEKLMHCFEKYLPWQIKYLLGKAGVGGMDISVDRHFEYSFVLRRLEGKRKGLLVEVGGAGSMLSPILCAVGYKVIGYDLFPWKLIFPNYEHRVGDACDMDFEDSSVDVCVSISCIEHMGTTRYSSDSKGSDMKFMKEALRILKPGGTLIISVPYGEARYLPSHRVYDDEQIGELTLGFNELCREIYVPVDGKNTFHYRIGTAEEAHIKRPWFRYSVIALELQK